MDEGLAGAAVNELREPHRLHRAVTEPRDDVAGIAAVSGLTAVEDDLNAAIGQLLPEPPLELGKSSDLPASTGPAAGTGPGI